jgi:hypothetical protein
VNVGELIRERERLLNVMQEAKAAKARLRQINILIAMYGDDEKVDAVYMPRGQGVTIAKMEAAKANGVICLVPDCQNGGYTRGLCGTHYSRWQKKQQGWQEIGKHMLPGKTHPGSRRAKATK